ncbi:hypothetical protein SAY86_020239 [Trapa natans]|uniref:Maternal effect embryo arrest 59 n=1 Tax=Trapa natans TaxID=22666 RepID=A0AAN7M154_TRANT|nr:hypothetical protein SAY86_020239 [Trapa natans]
MECCKRPNRSDVHLSRDEEVKIQEETREYFDGIAPKRHSKPQRSEYSSSYVDALSNDGAADGPIPELVEFRRLEDNHQKLVYSGSKVEEEFVETAYYDDLNCIDKQHHQTGTGFIKMGSAKGISYSIVPDTFVERHAPCKGNPATNDWIPSAAEMVNHASDKPSRSDN